MGRLRDVRHGRERYARSGRTRRGRLLAVAGTVGAAIAGVSACEPAGGLNTSSVAVTTDQAGTRALERIGVNVSWLSCTATLQGDQRATVNPTATAQRKSVATVDCQGQTARGSDITLTGRVTSAVDGRCVRGNLTARVAGQVVFRVSVLGSCDADEPTGSQRPTVTRTVQPPSSGQSSDDPTDDPPDTPPVTVTVTAPAPDPDPDPDPDPSSSDTCTDGSHDHDGQGGHDGRNDHDGQNGHDGHNDHDGQNDDHQDQQNPDQQHTWAAQR
ncbi:hypothetical protein AB0B79_04865 [Streptomyces sp. NPDC039022]|uniref:hypothetical protein n=1 Tax=unclassified Streptomyces TaxID=2593676 RepID=UPI0033F829D5